MRILILGGDGMLGHRLFRHLGVVHDLRATLRQGLRVYEGYGMFNDKNAYGEVDARYPDRVLEVLADFRPEAVVNAIGIVKQRPSSRESIPAIEINALFPHRLSLLCKANGARLIHMSTDCVFSGKKGNYREEDPADAEDLYGKSKFLGELHEPHCLTLRTSIIGRELSRKTGLLEWFLAQRGVIRGFRNAIFSGFTTAEMSRIIENVLVRHPQAAGVYHVSSGPISKYDLLTMLKKELDHPVDIVPDEEFRCDRSLDSSRFREQFGYAPPSWDSMVAELKNGMAGRMA